MRNIEATEEYEPLVAHFVDSKGTSVWYNEARHELKRGRKRVNITPMESTLLTTFILHPDELLSNFAIYYKLHPNDAIMEGMYGYNLIQNIVHPQISRLRSKLDQVGLSSCLETQWGDGYRFSFSTPEDSSG